LKPGLTSWLEHNARANPARLHPLDLYRRAYPRIVHLWDRASGTRTMSARDVLIRRTQGQWARWIHHPWVEKQLREMNAPLQWDWPAPDRVKLPNS
jgi:hypothetical protein